MKKLPFAILTALSAIAISLSTWAILRSYLPKDVSIEYSMYIGTNDKETYELVLPLEECRETVRQTMMDHFSDGFTMYEAFGVWRDEYRHITLEYSFVCILEAVDSKEVYAAADELLVLLNQSTILVVENEVRTANFYRGGN